MLKGFFVIFGLLYSSTTFAGGGYIGVYNTTGKDFTIGKVRIGCLNLEKVRLDDLYATHFERKIENTEYLNEIVPAKGFFVIGYDYNYKNKDETVLVELLSQNKQEIYNVDLFFSEEKTTYYGSCEIAYRFAGMCNCSLIPDRSLSRLCDMLL